ncbi:MAG: radical SAM protein [Candidatus Helarchaeota archaeon]
MTRIKYRLKEIDLHLTNKCNLKCYFCSWNSVFSNGNFIPPTQFYKLIKEAVDLGLEDLHLTGGEPTLHPNLLNFIKFCTDYSINIRLQTNGFLLNEDFLNKLKNAGLHKIMFSLDGDEKTHDYIRGKGSFKKVITAIESAKNIGFEVRINTVICHENIMKVKKILHYIYKIKPHIYSLFMFSPIGKSKARNEKLITGFMWEKTFNTIKTFITKKHLNIDFPIVVEKGFIFKNDNISLDRSKLIGCGAGCDNLAKLRDYIIITSIGDIYPCVFFAFNSKWSLGNCFSDTLSNIYNSSPVWEKYKLFENPPKECIDCKYINMCGGGCRGYAGIFKGNFYRKDYRCGKEEFKNLKYPLCPIIKLNILSSKFGGSTEQALEGS